MTTDITELAQSLKEAAEKATPGPWVAFTHADSRTFSVHTPDDKRCGDVIKWAGFDGQRKAKANAEFIALANPANVLALVEALEKAQAENTAGVAGMAESYETIISMFRSRIAELESRTVKLPKLKMLEDYLAEVAIEERKQILVGVKLEFHRALTSAGIKWEAE